MRREPTGAERYTQVAIAFHWSIAALIIANLVIGIFHDAIGGMGIHKAIGITVLALTIGRIGWRVAHPPPPLPADTPALQRGIAHGTHLALYALMLVMPLSGWAMSSAGPVRRPLTWFGLFDIPYLPVDKAVGDTAHATHETMGWVMIALVALHIGGALYHQFAMRDRLIARMMPQPR